MSDQKYTFHQLILKVGLLFDHATKASVDPPLSTVTLLLPSSIIRPYTILDVDFIRTSPKAVIGLSVWHRSPTHPLIEVSKLWIFTL